MRTFLQVPLLTIFFMLASTSALAKHGRPAKVEPIVHQGVRYLLPNDKGLRAYVEARDAVNGRKLWTKTIFKHRYIPLFGTECRNYEYVTSMALESGQLVFRSERGREYALDLRTRRIRQIKRSGLTALQPL